MPPRDDLETIAGRWVGRFDNHRQVEATLARGGPGAPELTRERRWMEVLRLNAPQLGEVVLFFQEFRAAAPALAHRQRVVSLVVDGARDGVRAEQLFFRGGPTYDRASVEPASVAAMAREDFDRHPGCDLFFAHEPEMDRFRGGMQPGACRYRHPVDGEVCADFEMLLHPDQLWYRDRSVRTVDGTVRGEIDGFSWLLFDRESPGTDPDVSLPRLTGHQGVWRGRFHRYDREGRLSETLPSEITVRVYEEAGRWLYHQTSRLGPPEAPRRTIEAHGEIHSGRVWFASDSFEGWAMDLPGEAGTGGAVLVMRPKDGAGPDVHEIISCSGDGRRRWRVSQFLSDGQLVGRTLIEEEKLSDDWRAHDGLADGAPAPTA
jgi:hypothetical protein